MIGTRRKISKKNNSGEKLQDWQTVVYSDKEEDPVQPMEVDENQADVLNEDACTATSPLLAEERVKLAVNRRELMKWAIKELPTGALKNI